MGTGTSSGGGGGGGGSSSSSSSSPADLSSSRLADGNSCVHGWNDGRTDFDLDLSPILPFISMAPQTRGMVDGPELSLLGMLQRLVNRLQYSLSHQALPLQVSAL
jgi:hypothetical protein